MEIFIQLSFGEQGGVRSTTVLFYKVKAQVCITYQEGNSSARGGQDRGSKARYVRY